MKALEMLKNDIIGKVALEELVNAFEKMCKIPIEGVEKGQEMILFETGTFSFSEESLFYFSLVRQFPNEEEEYCQIHLDIQYKPNDMYREYTETVWEIDIEGDIFEYIRNSEVYSALGSMDVYRTDVYMDET